MSRRNVNEHLHHRDSAKLAACGIDDLLSFTEGGKHDYDWLLTPPGTPDFPSSESEFKPNLAPTRSRFGRPTSNTNASRLSASNNHSRPARSSSVTRSSSISSSSQNNTNSSNKFSSILNNRPSSPITTRSPSSIRSSTPSRPSTPSRIPSIADKTRPSTPTHNKPATANLHSPSSGRSLSRPSTPTRRHSMTSFPSPTTTTTPSSPRVALNGRNSGPSSPSPRLRPPPQPIVPPDFPLETPPNLRTTLPNRPLSAGRSRPGAPITTNLKPNSETQASVTSMSRTQSSSPVVNRGRLLEHTGNGNGRVSYSPEVVARKSVKASTAAAGNNGFGRTISKKSLDMAIRHMDIRNSSGTVLSLSSATLFPQSIRTPNPKAKIQQPSRGLSAPASVDNDIYRSLQSRNNRMNGRGREIDERQYFAKLSEVEYHSSRYDALLLKEDLGNTNWLHSFDEKYDQRPIFDNGFESLPEPFALL